MATELFYKGTQPMTERRKSKRCPKCQFLLVLSLVLVCSLLVLFLINLLFSMTTKSQFQIASANAYVVKDSIMVDADLKMNFPEDVAEALENGIPLTIAVEVQVFRERLWWRNIMIKESLQLFELRYHPLTDVHQVKNIATEQRYSFNSRQDAMAVLGTIRSAHLIDKKKLNRTDPYFVQIRTLLDISRLPPALRQIASLSSSWRLISPWFRTEIKDEKLDEKQINKELAQR